MSNHIEEYSKENPAFVDQDESIMLSASAVHLGTAIPRDGTPPTRAFIAMEAGPFTSVVYIAPDEARVLANNLVRAADDIENQEVRA